MPEFKPRSGVRIADSEAAMASEGNNGESMDNQRVVDVKDALLNLARPDFKVTPLEFEKDDDNNLHMDFIVAASNLRAANYKIPPADRHKSKLIAGKIMPAIATTTSLVAGCVGLELIKLAHG